MQSSVPLLLVVYMRVCVGVLCVGVCGCTGHALARKCVRVSVRLFICLWLEKHYGWVMGDRPSANDPLMNYSRC